MPWIILTKEEISVLRAMITSVVQMIPIIDCHIKMCGRTLLKEGISRRVLRTTNIDLRVSLINMEGKSSPKPLQET